MHPATDMTANQIAFLTTVRAFASTDYQPFMATLHPGGHLVVSSTAGRPWHALLEQLTAQVTGQGAATVSGWISALNPQDRQTLRGVVAIAEQIVRQPPKVKILDEDGNGSVYVGFRSVRRLYSIPEWSILHKMLGDAEIPVARPAASAAGGGAAALIFQGNPLAMRQYFDGGSVERITADDDANCRYFTDKRHAMKYMEAETDRHGTPAAVVAVRQSIDGSWPLLPPLPRHRPSRPGFSEDDRRDRCLQATCGILVLSALAGFLAGLSSGFAGTTGNDNDLPTP